MKSISARRYYRWSFAAPLLVPLLALVPAVVSQLAIGSREATSITRLAIFFAFSLAIGGLPYSLFLTGTLLWCRGKNAAEIRRFTFVAPVVFAMVFLVTWVPFIFVTGSTGSDNVQTAFVSGGAFALYCLGLGYAYVLVVHGGYALLERWGKVGPMVEVATKNQNRS